MRIKKLLFVALSIFILQSCQKDQPCPEKGDKTISFANGDMLTIPNCWEHKVLQGIDSEVGEIIYPEEEIRIIYDIGELAGSYVDNEDDVKNGFSDNEAFIYAEVDKKYINSEDCCVFITFPTRGPANFITLNDHTRDAVMKVIETYKSN